MKKLLTMVVVAAALAFCASGARAGIGITTNFTLLNVSIILTTNSPPTTNNGVITQSSGKVKLDNLSLLNIFAHWAATNFPAGSKLVVGWDAASNVMWFRGTNLIHGYNGDPLIVDKSETNVLFDADNSPSNFFYVEFYDNNQGATSKKEGAPAAGSETYTAENVGYVWLYDDVYLPFTDFYTYGDTMDKFTQNSSKDGDFTTWSLSAQMTSSAEYPYGSFYYLGETNFTVSASASASGSRKGYNGYWYEPF